LFLTLRPVPPTSHPILSKSSDKLAKTSNYKSGVSDQLPVTIIMVALNLSLLYYKSVLLMSKSDKFVIRFFI
jgi:hypothetical protein